LRIAENSLKMGLETHTGSVSPRWGMFDIEVIFEGRAMLILNLAFRAGSSKHGNALRASVGWNCVVAIHLQKGIK
jgi:hypothetical protein